MAAEDIEPMAARFMIRLAGRLALLLLAGGAAAAAELPVDQEPGARIRIYPSRLPLPYATDSVENPPEVMGLPRQPPIRLPAGFIVNAFAQDLTNPRWMAVAPNGDLFVAESSAGKVTLLRDSEGKGHADIVSTFASGFRRPHGLAFQGDFLYVADIDGVWRLPWQPGMTRAAAAPAPVTSPGAFGGSETHWTRTLLFNLDGSRFYVAIGAATNLGEDPLPRASVQSFNADGGDQRTLAAGLRNPVGLALYPGTDQVYAVVDERDGMGDGLVPDFLTRLQTGGFYGWPYAYIGRNPQPDFPERPDLVDKTLVPDLLFQAHSSPLGLVFYEGSQFPLEYRGDAFVALHGSWNRGEPTGYKVVRVPFKNGQPLGYYETFLSGFWIDGTQRAKVWGRPAGLAVAADGSLLIADDVANVIWRVSYRP
jgi:glucose/arabinose dehydrogenase